MVAKTKALDKKLAEELSSVEVSAINSWKEARGKKDFKIAAPSLKKMMSLQIQKAQSYAASSELKSYFGDKNNYEILVDDYEPGLKATEVKNLLGRLVEGTKDRLPKLLGKASKEIIKIPMSEAEQTKINRKIVADLGFDFKQGRLDKSVHPFSGGTPQDIRMTTRYFEHDLLEGLTGSIHETGHGLYDSSLPREHVLTPCGEACSMGTHESQSRFYENFIGRSRAFSNYLSKLIDKPSEDIFLSLNNVKQSFERVEADEVTYNLHIALRMELEEKMILEKLSIDDLPEAWNSLFKSYFDLTPPSDLEGCLQDTHWYGGAVGYFPTYSIGNLLAAEFFQDFKKEYPEWEKNVSNGEFTFIRRFMGEKLHKHAAFYNSPETISLALDGRPLGEQAFLNYLDEKYL